MGDNTSWKISVKTEDELIMDKHKPGKVGKIFAGVFVCICIVAVLYGIYSTLGNKSDAFMECLEKRDYEGATKVFDYDKDYVNLVDCIIEKRMEYEKTQDKEVLSDMWQLIFSFESQIRVSDKNLFADLRYYPKEEKIVKIGISDSDKWYLGDYYNTFFEQEYYDESKLYDYYINIKMVMSGEDADIIIKDAKFELINSKNEYAKQFVDFMESYNEEIEDW